MLKKEEILALEHPEERKHKPGPLERFFDWLGPKLNAFDEGYRHALDWAGALLSMTRALDAAGLPPDAIDYINLHGTATRIGDAAEDHAIVSLFGEATPCSSTKGHTGHALGASGIVEAVISALSITEGFLPGSPHTTAPDPALRCKYITGTRPGTVTRVLSNSFGFGGSNASLILGRA